VATVSVSDELDRIIREALAGPPQSSSRLRPVDRRIAELLGLDPESVRAKVVDDAGVVENRLGEGGVVNRKPELVVILLAQAPQLERVVEKVARLTGPGTNIGAAAIFVDGAGRWSLASVVEPAGGTIETQVRAWYPDAAVRRPSVHGAAGVADVLRTLIERCKREIGYPREHDRDQQAAREELLAVLQPESLDAAITHPEAFDLAAFRRIASNAYGGAGNQGQINSYLVGGPETIPPLARTIEHLLYGPGEELERLDDVLDNAEWKIRGFGEALATKCLAIVYPDRWVPLFIYRGENGKRAVMRLPELPVEPIDERSKTRAQLATESNDVLRELLVPYYGEDSWGAMVFLWWLLKQKKKDDEDLITSASDVERLADELLLPTEWVRRVLDLLEDKKQVIFYGPPGTGKTYVARQLARFIAPDDRYRKTVQFHPSYSYEDFVEGYRPREGENGNVRYELTPGPLRRLAKIAEESAEACVLLIDEINRGNIAKVFGELYYLLEYRGDDDQIALQYGSDPFELPENFLIIATMNTADRSIAILDAALRRRFHFVEFFPDRWPVEGLLRRWLERHAPSMVYVADLVDAANRMLPDRHLQIGPSYFMRPGLDRAWLERIWAHSVLPYIEEQFFDEPDRVAEFELAEVEHRISGAGSESPHVLNEEVDHLEPETDPALGVAAE
jgi:5-methylcytosine-specific restriction protein B